MKYFNNYTTEDNLMWVVFKEEDDKQTFLNYLTSISEDNRYHSEVVQLGDHPSFTKEYQDYLNDDYKYAYANQVPQSIVEDFITLMGD